MNLTRPSPSRQRLRSGPYEEVRQQVLRRDAWRCQLCGAMSNLEVHHQQFRSQSGDDSEGTSLPFALRATPLLITAEVYAWY